MVCEAGTVVWVRSRKGEGSVGYFKGEVGKVDGGRWRVEGREWQDRDSFEAFWADASRAPRASAARGTLGDVLCMLDRNGLEKRRDCESLLRFSNVIWTNYL